MNMTLPLRAPWLAPTHTPPPLSRPAGQKRGANSRIWSCALRGRGQRGWLTERSSGAHHVGRNSACALENARPTRALRNSQVPGWLWFGTSCLNSVGQIGLLAPLPAPAGVGRGGGDRGGEERPKDHQSSKQVKQQNQVNWNLTPITLRLRPLRLRSLSRRSKPAQAALKPQAPAPKGLCWLGAARRGAR